MEELWRTSTGSGTKQTKGVEAQGEKDRVEERGVPVRVGLMTEQARALGPRLVRAAPSTALVFLAFEFGRFELSQ